MILSDPLIQMFTFLFAKKYKANPQRLNIKISVVFKLKYPNAKVVTWKQIDVSKWQVSFKIKGRPYSSLYSSQGNWLETVSSVLLIEIPKEVQEGFGSRYGSKGLKHIYRINTPNQVIFEMLWSNGVYDLELLYDETGKMVGKLIC